MNFVAIFIFSLLALHSFTIFFLSLSVSLNYSQLPTIELIEWLKSNFNLDRAIEIGAGNNHLYHHLGIKGIDNYSEQIPAVKLTHDLLHQPSTNLPPTVEKLDAIGEATSRSEIAAIKKYQPETVITSWMTIKGDDTEEVDGGHRYAPDEDEILDTGVTYVFIGNEDIHGDRLIMNKPHKTYYFDWLVSRGTPVKVSICTVYAAEEDEQ